MYKLLFAEDETATREGILACIPWDELQITEVRSAKNGMAALELTEDWIPDILLTDIRMPRMNGLDLASKIREKNPDCSILLISGYSEVDYLKSAIKLKAIDFVDKPLKIDALKAQLQNAVIEQQDLHQKQNYIRQDICRAFQHDQNLSALIAGLSQPPFSLTLEDCCCSFSFHILKKNDSILGQTTGADSYFTRLCEVLSAKEYRFTGMVADEEVLLLQIYGRPGDSALDPVALSEEFSTLWAENASDFHNELHICAGPVVDLIHYYTSFQQSGFQRNNIFLHSDELFHYSPDVIEECAVSDLPSCRTLLQELQLFLLQKNRAAANDTLGKLFPILRTHYDLSRRSILSAYSNMLFALIQQQGHPAGTIDTVYEDLSECSTLEDANRCLLEYLANEQIPDQRPVSLTDSIITIIHEQYAKRNLSLDDISQQVHLSPSYICVKFKEETGKTLTQYINEYRIETSLSLLSSPENKINLIAEQVGFDNGNYYAKIFKKIKKMSPAEYRETQYAAFKN